MNNEEFIKKLGQNVVEFEYEKKNGEIRSARGTTNPNFIKDAGYDFVNPDFTHSENDNVSYWDLDKRAWRSFNLNRLVSVGNMQPLRTANHAILSLSGGLDSTCLLMKLLADGYNVRTFSFQYGQKHSIELEKVLKNIKFLQTKGLNVDHQIIDLTDVFSDSASSLCEGNGGIPKGDEYNEQNISSTVVENRNVIFSAIIYGKALAWANKTRENVVISQGVHAGDHFTYPDTRPESVNMAKELYRISNIGSERVDFIAPFVELDKSKVLQSGLEAMRELGFDEADINTVLSNTHSCYDPDDQGRSCGACATCIERKQAFEANKMIDPISYVF